MSTLLLTPISVVLRELACSSCATQIGRFGTVDWGPLDAGVFVSMVPRLISFFLLQRYYVDGIFGGAAE